MARLVLPQSFVRAVLVAGVFASAFAPGFAEAKNLMAADGLGDTYELLRNAYSVEVPDCGHMVPHITQELDSELAKPVFVFHIHVNQDDDRCTNTDRQRTEIRAKAADIVANQGETVYYSWKFRLDSGFQGAPSFTHIFQIKSDESTPIMTLTPRVNTLAIAGRIGEHGVTDLTKFRGVWVRVELRVLFADSGQVAMTIHRVSDNQLLFDYSGDADTWDANASGHDIKFGIYRSLNDRAVLRDEQVRFADFCASKQSASECADSSVPDPMTGGGAAGSSAGGSGGNTGAADGGFSGAGGSAVAGAGGVPEAAGVSGKGGNAGGPVHAAGVAGAGRAQDPTATNADDSAAACSCRLPGAITRFGTDAATSAALLVAATAWLRRRRR